MRKLFITISLLIISYPLFSESNIHKITDTRTKAYESMLQHLPESLREKYQFAGPTTTIPAMAAVWSLVKNRIFALYVGFTLAGAILFAWLFNIAN